MKKSTNNWEQSYAPIRRDIEDDESVINFIRNLLWGMWVKNEYLEISMVCGNCRAKSYITVREKDGEAICPCCERRNKFLPE